MKRSILAVCDNEQEYAHHVMDYLSQPEVRASFPFEVQVFTDQDAMESFCDQNKVQLLLIAQPLYEKKEHWKAESVLVLSEEASGPPDVPWMGKYQPMEAMMRKVLELSAQTGVLPPASQPDRPGDMMLIGIYSPVRRCLQTTFSFTLGQLLARKHKVLYLNLESCSGLGHMLRRDFPTDLSDLIYFLHNKDGRFPYHLEGMAQRVNGLELIPPVFSSVDLQRVEKEEWLALIEELKRTGRYDYVILDLSESIRGLFEILKKCARVYTIVREDGLARAKQEQYEELLACLNCTDILEKTRKCSLPLFRSLPGLENLTRGELAGIVGKLIEEDLRAR